MLHISADGVTWTKLTGDRSDGGFTGNTDRDTKVWHSLVVGLYKDVPCDTTKGQSCTPDNQYIANSDMDTKQEQPFIGKLPDACVVG